MNDGIGIGNWGFEEVSSEIVTSAKGSQMAIAQIKVWLAGVEFKPVAWGQSKVVGENIGDGKKGAQTDAIKKALSYFSIGNRAYHGQLEKNKKPAARPAPARVVDAAPASNGHVEPSAKLPTVKELQARCNELCGAGAWQTMVHKAVKVPISDGPILDKDMTVAYRQKTADYLDFVEQQKQAAKAS